jgi:ribosome-binding protein aMBF1 (putative translation factor)
MNCQCVIINATVLIEGAAINSMADVDDAEAVETSAKRVGQRIRKIREEQGLSQKELVEVELGTSAQMQVAMR